MAGILLLNYSCEELATALVENQDNIANLGWFGIDQEPTETIEDAIQFSSSSGQLPSKVDLTNHMPPIGNQGQYGTCVAWAVGYGHKSYMEAIDNDRTSSDLQNPEYQFSPKYLFLAIPSNKKGDNCGGTGFQSAYEVMLNKGITKHSVTPYTGLGDCTGSTSEWDAEAQHYKIENYREIKLDVDKLKQYLAQGRAVSFGARLGDNFVNCNSSSVISSDTYQYSGPHAYHAMILVGYDDNKGTNGAFKVQNSWGESWGDNGYVWIDYDFFVGKSGEFAFCAFIAQNKPTTDPDVDGDNTVDNPEDGLDVMAWELYDLENYDQDGGRNRIAKYNVFNSGNQNIPASRDWNIIYIYYNAYDAEDYGVILYDYYTNDYGSLGDDGELEGGDGLQNWYNNANIPAGQSVAQALYGGEDARFSWPYQMPNISGEYYLVLIADGYDVLNEVNEENNFYYLTDVNGEPIKIVNGIIQDQLPTPAKATLAPPRKFGESAKPTVRTKRNRNTYTPAEITRMLKDRRKSGEIRRKAMRFASRNTYPKRMEKR